jgi:hypothetical protein
MEDLNTPAVVTLRQCVMSAINRAGLDTKRLEQLMAIGVECLTELNLFNTTWFKVVYLPISDINTVALPSDYIDYVKPPAIVVNGRIWTLTQDDSLPLQAEMVCGDPQNPPVDNTTIEGYESMDVTDYINNISTYSHQYGTSGGQNVAYFRIDKESRLIVLKGSVPGTSILLEYVSSGISLEGETLVPREVMATIRQYVIWQSIENNSLVPMNEKERKKEQYEDQLKLLTHFQSMFTCDEFKDTLYGASKQTAKR